jgi:hypothetical protein
MRKRCVKGKKEIAGLHIHELFIHANEFDSIDGIGTNTDDTILDAFVEPEESDY